VRLPKAPFLFAKLQSRVFAGVIKIRLDQYHHTMKGAELRIIKRYVKHTVAGMSELRGWCGGASTARSILF
jgi:hypothetical protein